MPIPSEINDLVRRLNRELDQLETEATEGLALARNILDRFPDNFTAIQLFAFLNTSIYFAQTARNRIQIRVESLSTSQEITSEDFQEAGEDFAAELGRIRVHLNFEENQEFDAFWEWGMGNWELKRESFCKTEMIPSNPRNKNKSQ